MTGHELVRAWKDPEFHGDGVDHPAGEIVLEQSADRLAGGVVASEILATGGCEPCGGFTVPWDVCLVSAITLVSPGCYTIIF